MRRENFGRTAAAESDGRQALEGGDLGWRKAGELPTLFEDVVPNLEKGEVSDVYPQLQRLSSDQARVDVRGAERHVVKQTHARHILIKTNGSHQQCKSRVRGSTVLRSRIVQWRQLRAIWPGPAPRIRVPPSKAAIWAG